MDLDMEGPEPHLGEVLDLKSLGSEGPRPV